MNRDTLRFVEEAKEFFNESENHHTYRDKDEEYIALRYGLDRDCIKVYRLGEELEFFEQWCDKVETPSDKCMTIGNSESVLDKILNRLLSMTDDQIVEATSYKSESTNANEKVIQDLLKKIRQQNNLRRKD